MDPNTKYYGAAAQYHSSDNSSPVNRLLRVGALFFGVIILLAIVFTVLGAITDLPKNENLRLLARQKALYDLVNSADSKIKNDDLHTVNSTARLVFGSDNKALDDAIKNLYGESKIPEDIAAEEKDATSETALKDAATNNTYDTVYLGILRQKMDDYYQLASDKAGGSSGSFQSAILTSLDHIRNINVQLGQIKL